MFDETKTAETPNPSDGDLSEATESQAPEGETRDAESREPDYKRMYLDAKSKVERANALEAENAELKERLEQSPAAHDAELGEDDDEQELAQVREFAAKGDPVARRILKERDERLRLERNTVHLHELQEIEDPKERVEVREHFRKNRQRLGDVKAARAEVREKKLEADNARLRDALKKATVKNDPDVVRTEEREVPASEHKKRIEMTPSDFDELVEKTRAEEGDRAARALQTRLANDEIVFKR